MIVDRADRAKESWASRRLAVRPAERSEDVAHAVLGAFRKMKHTR